MDIDSSREARVAWHRALGDPHRLAIVDALDVTDATPGELGVQVGLSSNLLAFHLDALEAVGIVTRHASAGDGRRRYVALGPSAPTATLDDPPEPALGDRLSAQRVLFVCSHNSARSQLAAGRWTDRTGRPAWSAGADPAAQVHPLAVATAADHGLDLDDRRPVAWSEVAVEPDLVVSVCDRAHEATPPFDAPLLHWSLPEPRTDADFVATWDELDRRIERLARRVAA